MFTRQSTHVRLNTRRVTASLLRSGRGRISPIRGAKFTPASRRKMTVSDDEGLRDVAVVWLRQDLRLLDNPPLLQALKGADRKP